MHAHRRLAVAPPGPDPIEALVADLAADPRPWKELTRAERRQRLARVAGIGRGLFSTSEEFARRKQEEIRLEEERFGR